MHACSPTPAKDLKQAAICDGGEMMKNDQDAGSGLANVQRIIHRHGGATFSVSIPKQNGDINGR